MRLLAANETNAGGTLAKASKLHLPTASLNEPNSMNLPLGIPSLQMGMGMSQNYVENPDRPTKKRTKFQGDLINPNARRKKFKQNPKFL